MQVVYPRGSPRTGVTCDTAKGRRPGGGFLSGTVAGSAVDEQRLIPLGDSGVSAERVQGRGRGPRCVYDL